MGIKKKELNAFKQYNRSVGLDLFMGEEIFCIDPIFKDWNRNWTIFTNSRASCNIRMPYLLIFDNYFIDDASKCCKISMLSSTYMDICVGNKKFWKLNNEEIEWLNNTIRLPRKEAFDQRIGDTCDHKDDTVWNAILYQMSDQSGYNYFDIPIMEYHDISFGGNIYLDKDPEPWEEAIVYSNLQYYDRDRDKQIWRHSKCSKEAEEKHMQKVRKKLIRKSLLT